MTGKKNMPLVSIILPAYKDKYLYDMIDSLIHQSYTNFELIIVDDASPYNLRNIVSQFQDNRISYFRNQKNLGSENLVNNWNYCFTKAKGEFVVLSSDDDIYHPDFLSTLINLAEKYPNVDLFHCRTSVIDENRNLIYVSASIAEYESDIDFIYQRFINRRTQLAPDFMFRRKALESIGGFVDYPKAWYSDDMTWFYLALNKGVVCAEENLFFWRSSLTNISSLNDDILQKAEASALHFKLMQDVVQKLSAKNKIDQYLLGNLKKNLRKAIGSQLVNDIAKANLYNMIRVISTKQYRSLLCPKDLFKLMTGKFRYILHI